MSWAVPDPETTRRIIVQRQTRTGSPVAPARTDGRWRAVNATTDLLAGSLPHC